MALTVRNNMAALNSIKTLNRTQNKLTGSLAKISSGLRVNSASDDAAGLSVATRQTSDNTSLKQAMRNANDGISLIQTAEGGLNEVYNILVRMRELAVQGSNQTYNSGDRSEISKEFTTLANEIKRIASVANFNRTKVLNSSTTGFALQVGIHKNADNKILLNLASVAATWGSLGISSISSDGITTLAQSVTAINIIDTALKSVNSSRSTLGAFQNRLESTLNEASNYSQNLANSSSQILDVDYATESANMTRYQIMQQAGVAALGQAKAIPQSIISLLS
ncbi:MAG: flagellin FliC [Deltaproteobacteria bacterium]|nr:flagellin FliC [Deltaproteobacteria bacterium]